ncbi:secretion protein HylD [alpha proteobacterium AAP81b]|nr:secretion protein HylD [alpha proteobacterium AAP81b]
MNMHTQRPDPATAEVYSFPPAGEPAPSSRRPRWLVPVIAVLVIAAVAYGIWQWLAVKPPAPPVVDSAPRVTVIVPGTIAVANTITAPGSIAARRDALVGVQGDGGRVTAVLVDAGQRVGAGQVLARIDRAVQVQQAAELAAAIRQSEADARLAEANLTRAQSLVGKGFISKADIDQRTATRDGALARVAVARAQLAQAQERIARLDVRAPQAGLILARNVEAGQVVGPGTGGLFRIAVGGVLEMRAQVAEQDMARLRVGMPASITPVGATTSYQGRIWLLDPVIDPTSRLGTARIALAYAPGLRVGAFARATVEAGDAIRPVLPQAAVQADDKGNYVMIVGPDGRALRRAITIASVGDQGVAIASGLDGRERVIASAGAFLREGEKITPILAVPAR